MLKYLAAYLGAGLAFAVIDAVWLTTVGPRLYRPALDEVLADRFNLPAAIAFYLVFIAGVLMLAINWYYKHKTYQLLRGGKITQGEYESFNR